MNNLSLKKKNHELNNLLFRLSVTLISIMVSFLVFSYTSLYKDVGNKYLFLLPMIFGLFYFIFPKMSKNRYGSIGLNILNVVLLLRYLFLPILIILTYNKPFYRGTIPSNDSMIKGQLLMIIELFTVFMMVELFSNKFYKFKKYKIKYSLVKNTDMLRLIFCISLVPFFIFPDLIFRYNFFLNVGNITTIRSISSVSGLWVIISELSLVLFPLLVINICGKQYQKNFKIRYLLFSIISIIPSITLVRGSSRFSVIIPAICFTFILVKTFRKHEKFIFLLIATFTIVIFLIYTFKVRAANPNISNTFFDLQETKEYFDAYLGGPYNMGRVLTTEKIYGSSINLNTIVNDWIYNMPLLSSLADGMNTTSKYFNESFYGYQGVYDQIVPMTGQSFLHFGYLGTPIYLAISTYIMMYFDYKFFNQEKIEYSYIYIFIIIYSAISMGTTVGSLYSRFVNTALPIFLTLKINDYFVFKKKG